MQADEDQVPGFKLHDDMWTTIPDLGHYSSTISPEKLNHRTALMQEELKYLHSIHEELNYRHRMIGSTDSPLPIHESVPAQPPNNTEALN